VVILRSFLGALALLFLASGCSSGPKLVVAKGQLSYKQKLLKVDPKASITVLFTQVEGEKPNVFAANPLDLEDMTFVVPGRGGKGIPVGKYRIAVELIAAPSAQVQTINAMFSKDKTAVVREVNSADQTIVIDLSKPEG
jgi:hypothetical protein